MQLHGHDAKSCLVYLCVLVLLAAGATASPQATTPATNSTTPAANSTTQSCIVSCPATLDPCNCGSNETCVLIKRTCGQCAKNVCQVRVSASQTSSADTPPPSSQVSLVLIGVCGAGVVALLAGGLFVFYRRRRLSNTARSDSDQGSMDNVPHHSVKQSMESTRDFIHPGAPWVRSVNNDRSSVASSVATGWGVPSEMGDNGRSTLMLARASTALFSPTDNKPYRRDTSFDDSNSATGDLAALTHQELLLPEPAMVSGESMLHNFKDPSFVEDNTPILPNIPSVDSFARLSFSSTSFPIPNIPPPKSSPPQRSSPLARDSRSVDIKRNSASIGHSMTRSIGALSMISPIEAPKFPPPRMPPPRVPSTCSSIFPDDQDILNARNSHGIDLAEYKFPRLPLSAHHVGGTAGNRDSMASVSSTSSGGSIAQVNVARVEPLRARTTIIQQKPLVGSIHDMQAERTSRMLNGEDARDRLSAVGSASFHRVAASMGGSTSHRQSLSSSPNTEQAYRKLVQQGIVEEDSKKTERERRRSSMVREAMKRASVEFVVRDGALVRKSDEL